MLTLDVRTVVSETILRLLGEIEEGADGLSDDAALVDLGLNSLTLARLVVELETALEVDPFSTDASLADIRSVGDLIATYQRALDKTPSPVEV